jgi:hypothetical protein
MGTVHLMMHNLYVYTHPSWKILGDAVSRASDAPTTMRLHPLICRTRINMIRMFAASGGERVRLLLRTPHLPQQASFR